VDIAKASASVSVEASMLLSSELVAYTPDIPTVGSLCAVRTFMDAFTFAFGLHFNPAEYPYDDARRYNAIVQAMTACCGDQQLRFALQHISFNPRDPLTYGITDAPLLTLVLRDYMSPTTSTSLTLVFNTHSLKFETYSDLDTYFRLQSVGYKA
jgi:hypothetical protein